ncbi:MAG: DUF5706 domain-containing protein [Erysipelotrichaceae bacterium]|nr:DUF5706 domain-containing protein [Erysipelotrichaceae bacterium]
MNKNEEKYEILSGISNQISSFDNKASILISAIGIVFALSLSFLDVFCEDDFLSKCQIFKIIYYALFILFIINTIVVIGSYILVIIPRKKIGNNKYANYYNDIADLDIYGHKEYDDLLEDYTKNDNLLTEQIIINSKICKTKHLFLKVGIISLIPFSILLLVLIVLTII